MATRTKKSPITRRTSRRFKPSNRGTLIIIGGKEDKENEMCILKHVAEHAGRGRMVVVSAASEIPFELWETYHKVFRKMGIKDVQHLQINQPADCFRPEAITVFDGATSVFFTGGDQLRITTKMGGTPIIGLIREIHAEGGLIAGTSAGASVMGEMMLVGGENTESHKVGNWMMAPGLRFVDNMIIDQHFAQRGRIGRLLGAVALNPGLLGIGIDEDTSIVVKGNTFKVLGGNAVYVVDGTHVSYTNISEASAEKTMSMHDVRLHVLGDGETFEIVERKASRT